MNRDTKKSPKLTGVKKKNLKAKIKSNDDDIVVSEYFSNNSGPQNPNPPSISDLPDTVSQLLECCHRLNLQLNQLKFSPPVKYIYNPTEYAFDTFKNYILTYGSTEKKILFIGMNPGPWGMSQTGVPFGEINAVKNWLKIDGVIGKPPIEEPSRPVQGFNCSRSEVSGKRFWDLAKFLSKTPDQFFRNCFVHNYCPLQFIADGGKNVTPADMKIAERESLYKVCDVVLADTIKILNASILIGIGKFSETRFKKVVQEFGIQNVQVHSIPHPSPRAVGNTDWQNKAYQHLTSLNLISYF